MYRQFAAVSIGLGLAMLGGSSAFGQALPDLSGMTTQGTSTGGSSTALGSLNLGAGMTTGNERYLQQNRQAGQFVGGGFQGVGSLRGQPGLGGAAAAMTGLGTGMGQFGMMNPMSSLYAASMLNNLSRQRRPLRMPVSSGIEPTPALIAAAEPAHVGQRVQSKLVRIPQVRGAGSVNVAMEGQVAVLQGEVKSQRDRDLIGRMLLLEPGVSDVRNELVVAPPVPSP